MYISYLNIITKIQNLYTQKKWTRLEILPIWRIEVNFLLVGITFQGFP